MKKTLLILFALILTAAAVHAQMPDMSWKDEMAKLSPMEGEWRGEGWIQMGPNGRSTFLSHEVVQQKLSGRALLIEGHGYEKGEDGTKGRVRHEALAVVTWDPESNSFRFDAISAQAGRAEARLTIQDDGKWVWGIETPRGEVRYSLSIEGDAWHEIGEFNPSGGEEWIQFLEMKLERVK